jgi:hypothetical protein
MNQTEWQIKSAAHSCSACRREFTDGETFTSSLGTDPEAGFIRTDTCGTCRDTAPAPPALSRWKTQYHTPAPPPPEAIRRETAETLLRRLVEADDPGRHGAIFVLTVMLERRRILVERDVKTAPEGGKLRIYEHRGTGETFVIADPELKLHDLEAVQNEVMALLSGPEAEGPAAGLTPDAP